MRPKKVTDSRSIYSRGSRQWLKDKVSDVEVERYDVISKKGKILQE